MAMRTSGLVFAVLCLWVGWGAVLGQTSLEADDPAMDQLLISKIDNLEKKMEINLRIMKRQLRRDIRRTKQTTTSVGTDKSTVLDEVKNARADIKQMSRMVSAHSMSLNVMVNNSMGELHNQLHVVAANLSKATSDIDDIKHYMLELNHKVNMVLNSSRGGGGWYRNTTRPSYRNTTRPPYRNSTWIPTKPPLQLGFANGTGIPHTSGRLQVNHNGELGTICDDGWSNRTAHLACKYMSSFFCGGHMITTIPGQGRIWLDDFTCRGTHDNLMTDCSWSDWGVHNCDHSEDVTISCTLCSNYTRSTPRPTRSTPSAPGAGATRLVNGSSPYEGRVEIFYSGEWGTICDDDFETVDAQVVCRQLGFSGGSPIHEAAFGQGTGPILLDNVGCRGTETNLLACSNNGIGVHNCGHGEDVGVRCNSAMPTTVMTTRSNRPTGPLTLRLADGTDTTGRVEVYHGNQWGTICDDGWTNYTARLACKHINSKFCDGKLNTYNIEGSGQIWLDDVSCAGKRENLTSDCGWSDWGYNNCGHSEDVTIACTYCTDTTMKVRTATTSSGTRSTPTTTTYSHSPGSVRLVNLYNHTAGRVEVYYEGAWWTVCDDDWDSADAQVVCRQLGLSGGVAIGDAHFGQGGGGILLDNVNCTGNELHLFNCSHNGYTINNCGHDEDASVLCAASSPGPATTTVAYTTVQQTTVINKLFAVNITKNVSVGNTVVLECSNATMDAGNGTTGEQVVWTRPLGSSYIVLAMGGMIYTNDKRFEVEMAHNGGWNLRIRNVSPVDASVYSCRAPPSSLVVTNVTLNVHAKEESTTPNTNCVVELQTDSAYIACMTNFVSQVSSDSGDMPDEKEMMEKIKAALCSPDACMPRFFQACPALKETLFSTLPLGLDLESLCSLLG